MSKNDSKKVDTDTIVIIGHYQIKTILQKMAQGIKTIDTIGQQLPTLSLVALLHCLVLSHLEYSAIFFQQINATLMLSLEKHFNWALKEHISDRNLNLLPFFALANRSFESKKELS